MHQRFPGVDFRFQMISGEPQGPIGDVDLGVRLEQFADPNDRLDALAPEIIVPVSSSDYHVAHRLEEFRENAEGLTFLSFDAPRLSWSDFLGQTLYKSFTDVTSMTFTDYSVILQAAMAGKGIALGWVHLIAHQLKSRMLVICGGKVMKTRNNYMLGVGRGLRRRRVAEIRDWMLAEMQLERQIMAGLYPAIF